MEEIIVSLPISDISAQIAGAPASQIEHYVRMVGRPSNQSGFISSPVGPVSLASSGLATSPTETDELCPFCGDDPILIGNGPYRVECKGCGVTTKPIYSLTEDKAFAVWNRRVPPSDK
jgi:hypothetical protein